MTFSRLTLHQLITSTLLIFLLGFGCTSPISLSTANWNDHIPEKERSRIKALDDQLIAAFNEGDSQKLSLLYSDALKTKMGDKTEEFVNSVHPMITSNKYDILDEYLSNNSAVGTTLTLFKGVSGDNDYKIIFNNLTEESYVSLILFKDIREEFLFTCIYGKYGGNWKLNVLQIGPYKIAGYNAIDFYKRSKKEYDSGNWADAAIDINLARETALPAKDYFSYFKMPEMQSFGMKLESELASKNSLFPITINEIKTLPQIFGTEPAVIDEGVFLRINYLSKIKLADTIALKAENEQIKKVIGRIFPGIDKNKKYVFFKAYNEMPDGKTIRRNYGFALKRQ